MTEKFDEPARYAATIGQNPIRPLVALTSFYKLTQNKEDTIRVFEIIRALSGRSLIKQYRRMLSLPEGGRQAYLAPELADLFQDDSWLSQFAEGTVGNLYRRFIGLRNLSAYGLAEETRRLGEVDLDAAHPIAWFARRQRDVHDVWHVLTGYGTDALGEASLLGFTYAQTGNFSVGFIAFAAALELKRNCPSQPYLRAVYQGWRHGKQAASLMAQDYERLFAEPLVEARRRLAIARPTAYDAVAPEARNANRYPAETVLTGYWPPEIA